MHTLRFSLFWCIGLTFAVLAHGQDAAPIRVDRQELELLSVVDGWAIWRTSHLIERTRFHRGQSFDHRIYRQRIPDPIAHFVMHEVGGPGFNRSNLAITDDGTLVSFGRTGGSVRWFHPDGTVKESGAIGLNRMRMRAYADGVLLRVSRTGSAVMSHVFVPFREEVLDFHNQVEIRSWDDRLWRATPVRHGSVMLWNTPERLWRLNLKTGERSSDEIEKLQPGFSLGNSYATAFDGELALLGSNVLVDSRTGKLVNWDDARISGLFMTHNWIGYRVWEGNLEAIDIERPDQPPVFLSKVHYLPIGKTESGILIWTGKQWKTVPWYAGPSKDLAEPRDAPKTRH